MSAGFYEKYYPKLVTELIPSWLGMMKNEFNSPFCTRLESIKRHGK